MSTPRASPQSFERSEASAFTQAALSGGVLLSFSISSLTQEALTRTAYDGERFEFKNCLLFIQSAAAAAVACAMLVRTRAAAAAGGGGGERRRARADRAGLWRWVVVVGAYYASHWLSLASLRDLSYPVHVTVKSCKAIPVAVGERVLTGTRHPPAKYLGVLAMCVGVALFLLCTPSEGGGGDATATTGAAGIAMVAGALVADGVYAGHQADLVTRCASEWTLMLHMNAWQGVLSLAQCYASGDEVARCLAFVRRHPACGPDLVAFTVSKAVGNLCVYRLLRESGTIVVATVTTLRKVLSVLLSVYAYGHAVSAVQWAALGVVFLHKYVGRALAALLAPRRAKAD